MPCDCPEDQSRPAAGGCNYLICSGGSSAGFYRLVEHAIPADVELAHGRPIVHPDGSLEFPGPPPALSGYRQDGWRLCPAWPPCTWRILRVQVVDGALAIDGICGNPEAGPFSREVTGDECQPCPARRP